MPHVIVESSTARYEVLKLVARASTYSLYICRDTSEKGYLLQIASERAYNGGIERAAYVLRSLMEASRQHDEIYMKDHEGHRLHFDRLFPDLIETFISEQQERRRVNILSFTDVPDVTHLLPMSNLKSKDRLRVDPKTNAWILGRLLKLMTLVHAEGVTIRTLSSNNVLLEPDKHFAIVLDWSSSRMHQGDAPIDDVTADVVHAAQAAYDALGDVDNGHYIFDDADMRYIDLLRRLVGSEAGTITADQAHAMFYELVREIWPIEFHPFTTLPL